MEGKQAARGAVAAGEAPIRLMIAAVRALGKVIYWTAVILISLALVVALILYFESLDASQVGG